MPDEKVKRLVKEKKIAVVGVGGTGCYIVKLLGRFPLKRLVLIDRDVVEKENLPRQILYSAKDIGKAKVAVAKEKVIADGYIKNVEAVFEDVNADIITELGFDDVDIIIDCTDNVETRLVLNDYCKKNEKAWIYTAAIGTIGNMFFNGIDDTDACFQCFNKEKFGEVCDDSNVSSAALSTVASFAVTAAFIFLVSGKYDKDITRFDVKDGTVMKIKVKKDKKCDACNGEFVYLERKKGKKLRKVCSGRHEFFVEKKIDRKLMSERLKKYKDVVANTYYIASASAGVSVFLYKDYCRILVVAKNEKDARKKYDRIVGM